MGVHRCLVRTRVYGPGRGFWDGHSEPPGVGAALANCTARGSIKLVLPLTNTEQLIYRCCCPGADDDNAHDAHHP